MLKDKQLKDEFLIEIKVIVNILKPLGAKWIESLHRYILDNPSIIINGFKAAEILDVL